MYYLAVDIGASSGRHILGEIKDGKLVIEEIYRFSNGAVKRNGHICWELDRLFAEIINGMKKCAEIGKIPHSMGIDCFGVDFVLLDKDDNILGDTVAYRDTRTEAVKDAVNEAYPDFYKTTGIAEQIFNSVYQLAAIKKEHPEYIDAAKRFLMLTEYFNFRLTGNKKNEYTNATTTMLLNAETEDFDGGILDAIGVPKEIFSKPEKPGTLVGTLREEIKKEVGFDCEVILPATHDTGSAVFAVPTNDKCIFLSSGTWSLMGTVIDKPICTKEAKDKGFTNEGGVVGIRFLKNIMGLWIIQSVRHELGDKYSFAELCDMAEKSLYPDIINVNDSIFFSPESMIDAINEHLKQNCAPKPETVGDMLKAVYGGLAKSYGETVAEIEEITGEKFDAVYIIGGGSRDGYLNTLTAEKTGKTVFAGPTEATAIGNLLVQAKAANEITTDGIPDLVSRSFDVKKV